MEAEKNKIKSVDESYSDNLSSVQLSKQLSNNNGLKELNYFNSSGLISPLKIKSGINVIQKIGLSVHNSYQSPEKP